MRCQSAQPEFRVLLVRNWLLFIDEAVGTSVVKFGGKSASFVLQNDRGKLYQPPSLPSMGVANLSPGNILS